MYLHPDLIRDVLPMPDGDGLPEYFEKRIVGVVRKVVRSWDADNVAVHEPFLQKLDTMPQAERTQSLAMLRNNVEIHRRIANTEQRRQKIEYIGQILTHVETRYAANERSNTRCADTNNPHVLPPEPAASLSRPDRKR